MFIAPGVTWGAQTWPSSGTEAQGENPCLGQGDWGVRSGAGWKRQDHEGQGRRWGRAWGPSPCLKSTGTPKPSTALTGPRACAGDWRHLLCQPGLFSAWEMLPPGSNSHHPIADTLSATSWDHSPREAAEPFQSAVFWLQFMVSTDRKRPCPFDSLFRGPSGPRDTDPSLGEEEEGNGPKAKRNKMFQCVVLRSLAQLSWGLVMEGHPHGTTVPGPSKSFPLQSCGAVNEHEGLWCPQPWTQDRTNPQGPPAAPPASHPCPDTRAHTHPLCPLPAPASGRAPCAWGSLGWWWSLFVVVVIFNRHIVLDLRQRQQVGETCLALGAQRGKVGNALRLQENALPPAAAGPGRAGLSRGAHPEDCSSFYSLLALSPKSQALGMSRIGKKGLPAPEQAPGLVPWGCPMVASSRPMGQELILPLGTRDPTAPHPPLHRELLKSQESHSLPWKPRSPSPGSLEHPACTSPSRVNPAPSKHGSSSGGDNSSRLPLSCWMETNPGEVSRGELL